MIPRGRSRAPARCHAARRGAEPCRPGGRGVVRAGLLAAAWAVALAAPWAAAQPSPAPPSAGAFPDEFGPEPERHPFLRRFNARDWLLEARVEILTDSRRTGGRDRAVEPDRGFDIRSGSVLWPYVMRSSSAESLPLDAVAKLKFNDTDAPGGPRIAAGYHSGAAYLAWDIPPARAVTGMRFEVSIPVTCYDTEFDEAAAMRVGWPGAWPPVAASTFQPQQYVEVGGVMQGDDRPPPAGRDVFAEAVSRFLDKRDPRTMPPVRVAKLIFRGLAREMRERGSGIREVDVRQREAIFRGIEHRGARVALDQRSGSRFEFAAALAGTYRSAGLPARVVVAYAIPARDREPGESLPGRRFLSDNPLYPYVEFCLYDPAFDGGRGLITWVPVDFIQLMASGAHTHNPDRPWEFFGTHEGLNDLVPFAYHFHPPTDAYAFDFPGFFGLRLDPSPSENADQIITIDARRAPKRGSSVRESERRFGRPDERR